MKIAEQGMERSYDHYFLSVKHSTSIRYRNVYSNARSFMKVRVCENELRTVDTSLPFVERFDLFNFKAHFTVNMTF